MKKQQKNGGFLSLASILEAGKKPSFRDVEMPEWTLADGTVGVVRVKALTNEEQVKYSESIKGENEKFGNAVLVILSAVNEDFTPLFSLQDLPQIANMAARPFNRLARVALELNGVVKEEVDDAKNA
jgi:hypothetical protein